MTPWLISLLKFWFVDNLLLDHVTLPHILDLTVHLVIFLVRLEGTFLLIVLFYQSTPSCFKVIGGVVVAHKILLSAPVPIDPLVLELLWFYEWN